MPFRDGQPNLKVYLTYFEDEEYCFFCEKNDQGHLVNRENVLSIKRSNFSSKMLSRLWLVRNYQKEIEVLSEQQDISLRQASARYGELGFPHKKKKNYEYSDQFGLVEV